MSVLIYYIILYKNITKIAKMKSQNPFNHWNFKIYGKTNNYAVLTDVSYPTLQ